MTDILFYFFASLAVVAAAFILFTRNVLYAAFALVVSLLGVAVMYIFAGAEFLAVTQIMIYVGGIIVLIVFGVMLTHNKGHRQNAMSQNRFFGGVVAVGIFILLVYAVLRVNLAVITPIDSGAIIQRLGRGLVTDYVLVFEIAGILLLVALVGAAVIAGKKISQP